MRIVIKTDFYSYTSESTQWKNLGKEFIKKGHDVYFLNVERPNIFHTSHYKDELIDRVIDQNIDNDLFLEFYDLYNVRCEYESKLKSGMFFWGLLPVTKYHLDMIIYNRKPIFITGKATYNQFKDIYSDVELYQSGVDQTIFNPNGQKIDLGNYKTVFLWIGMSVPASSPDLVLKAYRNTFSNKEDNTLLIMIDGSNRVNALFNSFGYNKDNEPAIQFIGNVNPQTIAMYMRSVTALVIPVRFHCECRPILEAMSCGLPTITTAYTGPADYIDSNISLMIPYKLVPMYEDSLKLEEQYKPNFQGNSFCNNMAVYPFQWAHMEVEDIAEQMKIIHNRQCNLVAMRNASIEKAKQFTWENAAQKILTKVESL